MLCVRGLCLGAENLKANPSPNTNYAYYKSHLKFQCRILGKCLRAISHIDKWRSIVKSVKEREIMADQEQLEILKQGVKVWNKWRIENPNIEINLSNADLLSANLLAFNFRDANLIGSSLVGTNLYKTNLRGANLKKANLSNANIIGTYLFNANLNNTKLSNAKIRNTFLVNADLTGAQLDGTVFIDTNLNHANLSGVYLDTTLFARVDLSNPYGLEKINHRSSSVISTDTLQLSQGEIPEVFLRGCGLSDWEIESAKLYKPGLSNQEINNIIYKIFDLRGSQSLQISPLFISYSHADTPFIEKLEAYLLVKGIRFWRDIHNATAGRLEAQIDRAMRQNPSVLLVLSKNSTTSDWVVHEALLARQLEKEIGRDVLCPIALDDSWKSAKWPKRLMEQIMEYNILDYSKWNDDKAFEQVFNKMINGLDMFYKPNAESSR